MFYTVSVFLYLYTLAAGGRDTWKQGAMECAYIEISGG